MLVLTRKLEESVMIGTNVEVRILGVQGDHVRLGFSAPRNVPIFRKEVFEAIQAENVLAARPGEHALESLTGSWRKKFQQDGSG